MHERISEKGRMKGINTMITQGRRGPDQNGMVWPVGWVVLMGGVAWIGLAVMY